MPMETKEGKVLETSSTNEAFRTAATSTVGKPGNLLTPPVLGNSLLKRSDHFAEAPADCTHYLLQIEVGITKRKRVMMVEGN